MDIFSIWDSFDHKREDSKDLHCHDLHVCPHSNRKRNICSKYDIYTKKSINLSNIDLNEYDGGQKIVGNIKDDGLIVVKGNRIIGKVLENIKKIVYGLNIGTLLKNIPAVNRNMMQHTRLTCSKSNILSIPIVL